VGRWLNRLSDSGHRHFSVYNEKSSDPTRDLPACSIVPQPTTLPRTARESVESVRRNCVELMRLVCRMLHTSRRGISLRATPMQTMTHVASVRCWKRAQCPQKPVSSSSRQTETRHQRFKPLNLINIKFIVPFLQAFILESILSYCFIWWLRHFMPEIRSSIIFYFI
jgi:hypothetical protein